MSERLFRTTLRFPRFPRAELPARRSHAIFGDLYHAVSPSLVGLRHLLDVEILHSTEQEREAVDPLLHDLYKAMIPCSAKRWVGIKDRLARDCGRALHATHATIPLHGANWTRIEFVVN